MLTSPTTYGVSCRLPGLLASIIQRKGSDPIDPMVSAAALRRALGASLLRGRPSSRALSTGGAPLHGVADPRLGIGSLQLSPEETAAEQALRDMLPEFKEAAVALHGEDEPQPLTNSARAARALPALERAVEICRSAMGPDSVYLLAALRHLAHTHFLHGDYELANRALLERGELMRWPMAEQERVLRLFLRENRPAATGEWCQKDVFARLFPKDETVPLKWTIYELIGKSLQGGAAELAAAVGDPLFTDAVETLRAKKGDVGEPTDSTKQSLLAREIPYLTAQYASLCVVASDALATDPKELSDQQRESLQRAETLWKEALTWVERTGGNDDQEELTAGIDSPFEAWIHTNIGEVLLAQKKPEEAMEFLGKALATQQKDKSGNALGLARVLSKIAVGCHAVGQAVSSEGLFTTVIESFAKEKALSVTDQVEYARVMRAYGNLLANWEKREGDAANKYAQADSIQQAVQDRCKANSAVGALHPLFYLPL